ncbi:MAG TPA: sensor histidine kinase [Clostridiaceae bacterium]|nr:sensor histidine kinase [Clostridiaceae bacterium]
MRGLFLKLSFRMKLALVFVITLILSAVSVGFYSFHSARKIVRRDQRKTLAEITNLIIMNIDGRVGSLTRQMQQAAGSELMQSYAKQLPARASPELKEYYEAMENALGFVHAVYVVKNRALYVPTEDESVAISATDYSVLWSSAENAQSNTVWQGAQAPLHLINETSTGRQENVIRAVQGIRESPDGPLDALLVLELKAQEFDNLLFSNRASLAYQYRMIFDQNMQLMAANRRFDDETLGKIVEEYTHGERRFTVSTPHADFYVQGQYDGLTGWSVFSAQEVMSTFPSSQELIELIVQFVLVSSLLASFSVVILSWTITRPVKSLSRAMKSFEQGDYSVRLNPKGSDEMGQLMQSFNFMADEIDQLINQVLRVSLAQREAEIMALEAQINPHFLYNTLDSIQWMLIKENQFEIAQVIVSLGKIFRYSIDRDKRLVPLVNEVEYAEHYLNIQKYRLDDRLLYSVRLPHDLHACLVPRLILQPLIENAIAHGADDSSVVTVDVVARQENDLLAIEVRDDGKGMSEERLAQVKEMIEDDRFSSHLGLRNVHRRLRLQFGDPYGISIVSADNKGCSVTVRVPLFTEERDGKMLNKDKLLLIGQSES